MNAESPLLSPDQSVLLVVDMQEKFASAIPTFGQIQHRIKILLEACGLLNISVVASEQYPKGLGHTIPALSQAFPANTTVLEKTAFGCGADKAISDFLQKLGRRQVVLCGIETHVCVNQTAHQLRQAGYAVHLLQDATDSRKPQDREIAIAKMHRNGVIPGSVEMTLFEWLGTASHPQFKAIQTLIK
jgi:nicotinamidase-related amidase